MSDAYPLTYKGRFKRWLCERVGHRETYRLNGRAVTCVRCRCLLAGPKELDNPDSPWFGHTERITL